MYKFKVSPVYYANRESKAKIVINQGGTDSGKTYAIIQYLIEIATTQKAPKEDPIITIVSESIPNLKKGAYRVFKEIIGSTENLRLYIKSWNETDRTVEFKSGWIVEFNSYVSEQQAKQGKRQYLFCNEANGITYQVFWQLAKRTRIKTFVDYNPSAPFWTHEQLIGTTPQTNDLFATVELIISDHRHNPFLTEEEHARTENIKNPDLWRVYARGMTGNLTGLVFPNWKRLPENEMPKDTDFWGGLDFGYTNDPTAGVQVSKIGNNIYIRELCYEAGIAPIQIKELFTSYQFQSDTHVYCEHDPDMISRLRRLKLKALPATKGQGSIKAGISLINEFNVFYSENSLNLHEERTKYMYEIDKLSGKPTNQPIDSFNHCMDAIRYAVYTKLRKTR